jgi:hypothetical protein
MRPFGEQDADVVLLLHLNILLFPLLHPLQLHLPLVNVGHLVPSFLVIYLDLPTLFVGPDIAVLSLMVKQGDAKIISLTTDCDSAKGPDTS